MAMLKRMVEWVLEPLITEIRRDAYKAGREDALKEVKDIVTDIHGKRESVIWDVADALFGEADAAG